jgi:hypothetical protein
MTCKLEAVHLLATYRCDRECDHCFVWAGPQQTPTMSIGMIRGLLEQAKEIDSVRMVYFEGGEPFMYYPTLLEGVRTARSMGFEVGIVTNGFWGVSAEDARLWLTPLAELGISDLSVSDDEYHRFSQDDRRAREVVGVAEGLGIPVGVLEVQKPDSDSKGTVFFRGRAAEKLAAENLRTPASELRSCPEDLDSPGRVHIDPLGLVHVCQGLVIGDVGSQRLVDLMEGYDVSKNPITAALVRGGPAELVRRFGLELPIDRFADECHLCYLAREMLRPEHSDCLGPDEMYGPPG